MLNNLRVLTEDEFNLVLNKILSTREQFSECLQDVVSAGYDTLVKRLHWTAPTERKIETFIGLYTWIQHNFSESNVYDKQKYMNRLSGFNQCLVSKEITPYKIYIELHKVLNSAEYNPILLTIIRLLVNGKMSVEMVLASTLQLFLLCSGCPSIFNGDVEFWREVHTPLVYLSKSHRFTQMYIKTNVRTYYSAVSLVIPYTF